MRVRSFLTAAVGALLMASAMLIPVSPATAAGGGCIDHSRNGWNVGVCSSDNGVTVSADIYVNARGSLGSSCYIERYVVRYSGGGTAEAFIPTPHRIDGCATGRHTAITTSKIAGKLYRQYMQVVVNGNVVDSGWSPYTQ